MSSGGKSAITAPVVVEELLDDEIHDRYIEVVLCILARNLHQKIRMGSLSRNHIKYLPYTLAHRLIRISKSIMKDWEYAFQR